MKILLLAYTLIPLSVYSINYNCTFCKKKFSQKHVLTAHINTKHTNAIAIAYLCGVCNVPFNSMNTLNSHKRAHYKEPRFECPLCQRKFYHRQNFFQHKKNKHPEKTDLKANSLFRFVPYLNPSHLNESKTKIFFPYWKQTNTEVEVTSSNDES